MIKYFVKHWPLSGNFEVFKWDKENGKMWFRTSLAPNKTRSDHYLSSENFDEQIKKNPYFHGTTFYMVVLSKVEANALCYYRYKEMQNNNNK